MPTIQEQAETCMRALMRGEYAVYADHMHPRMLELIGGDAGLAVVLGRATAHMQASGLSFMDLHIGEPGAPRTTGDWLISLVPHTVSLRQRGGRDSGRLELHASLVGISEDAGRTWSFLDAASLQDPAVLAMYPELAGLELPAPAEPVFHPDP